MRASRRARAPQDAESCAAGSRTAPATGCDAASAP